MATPKAAWGIEIGASAIKAIRLEREGDRVSVSDFVVIPHKKVLTTPDLDQDDMVRISLGQFISQKDLEGEHLVFSVPGHAAFARFAKLPPVEPRKVPDIVKFEAVQQIPFPIEEVEWDYQTFTSEDSPEVEVGIFAMHRDRVMQRLDLYAELGLGPEVMNLSPVAVYNAMAYDHDLVADRRSPVIYLDIGTNATDVIVAEDGRCWIRTFPLGGTHFTEAIASAFKLSYTKAEKLKREAATSKYAKQIMQAMRPVFSDLLQDLQRSIGYYQNLHRDAELGTIVGLGSTFKIPGLRKFLGQQLQVDVVRLDEFKKIAVTGREAASFSESTVNMATAYGCALQGVGLVPIDANLVPVGNLRSQMWHAKTKWFAAAASIAVVGSLVLLWKPMASNSAIAPAPPDIVASVIDRGEQLKRQYQQAQADANVGFTAVNMQRLLDYRSVWPHIVNDATQALAAGNPQPELFSPEPETIRSIAAEDRRVVLLRELSAEYRAPAEATGPRRIHVMMEVELSHRRPEEFLTDNVCKWLRDNAERPGIPYRILPDTVAFADSDRLVLEADDDGNLEGKTQTTAGMGGGGSRPPRRGGDRGSRGGSPPTSTGSSFSGGTPGSAGGGTFGRRKPSGPGRAAPGGGLGAGTGLGGGGGGGGGNTGAPTPPPNRGGSPLGGGDRGRPGGAPGQPAVMTDIERQAPIPRGEPIYESGDRVYRFPVYFEVELIDPAQTIELDQAAAAGLDNEEVTG